MSRNVSLLATFPCDVAQRRWRTLECMLQIPVSLNLTLIWRAPRWTACGRNCGRGTFWTVDGPLCSDWRIAQRPENYVAETITPPQHRQPGKHPDVPLPGSSLSSCKQSEILSDLAPSLSLKVISFFSFLFCLLLFFCCEQVIVKVSRVSVNCVFSQVFKMSELLRQLKHNSRRV